MFLASVPEPRQHVPANCRRGAGDLQIGYLAPKRWRSADERCRIAAVAPLPPWPMMIIMTMLLALRCKAQLLFLLMCRRAAAPRSRDAAASLERPSSRRPQRVLPPFPLAPPPEAGGQRSGHGHSPEQRSVQRGAGTE
eukprot:gene16944-biopygen5930